ncbi:VOC family protein [Haloarchaeobius sp. DT45]|uniref:VOC family protein n=1 Tax=Haloarchaeobius sp. DT45 TaxID=3446116 RepID=UPI003F6BAAD7
MAGLTDVSHTTVLVHDQQEALEFYTEVLGFETRDDQEVPGMGRWLTVGVPGKTFPQLTLVEADTDEKREAVGSQAGDHVLFVVNTDDCRATDEALGERGVEFHGEPEEQPWGTEVVFEDLYENLFDLLEPAEPG